MPARAVKLSAKQVKALKARPVLEAVTLHPMHDEIGLHLPEPPSSNRYWRVGKGRVYRSKLATAYRETVRSYYLREFGTLRCAIPDGTVSVQIVWTRGRKAGDLDNRIKQVCDALQGLAFTNDIQIVELHAYRRDAKGQPGIFVTVTRVGDPNG